MKAPKLSLFGLLLALLSPAQSASPSRMDKGERIDQETAVIKTPTIRLYLIRHGETLANIQKVVVGQLDSPLTKLGKRQAAALGNSSMIRGVKFWRRYSSDLQRTQHTARLVDSHHHFTLDERLREIAKGARQGFPKSYTMDQCMESFKDRPEEIPKHESSDDAWKRLSSFLLQLVQEAVDDEVAFQNAKVGNKVRNVLIVSHSGTLRLLLHKLVPGAHPLLKDSAETTGALDDSKRFQIPNTSLTTLDISITPNPVSRDNELHCLGQKLSVGLITLNSIDHFSNL
ncbi:unnamed protein product [Cylindrotheca closterium]|uniref:Phosphoglycerate mutase n=1 Tax=Cylindrotheca closterium TaxID=2856 RepID=A0AAD2JH41_9STRA|nr:unnamed protein product [Cylindrotheca closterium]